MAKNKTIRYILKVRMQNEIVKLHEEIFIFAEELIKNKTNFPYLLRSSNAYERLDMGYWFLGDKEELFFSFWEGTDKNNDFLYISFIIKRDGESRLRFSANDNEQIAKIFKTISTFLPETNQLKEEGKEVAIWEKKYEGNEYLKHLANFIAQDKPKIEAIISLASSEVLAVISPVKSEDYSKNVAQIYQFKQKKEEPIIEENNQKIEPYICLKKLCIENIGIFTKLEFDFSEKVTILIGENGIGKTTILRAIALALAGISQNSLLEARNPKVQQLLRIENEAKKAEKGFIRVEYQLEKQIYQNTILFTNRDKYGVKVEDDSKSDFKSLSEPDIFQI